jgi:hypothetical protein
MNEKEVEALIADITDTYEETKALVIYKQHKFLTYEGLPELLKNYLICGRVQVI